MTVFNLVRMRAKPGREQEFLEAHERVKAIWPGLLSAQLIKTGERSYTSIAEWVDADRINAARPQMRAALDVFRDTLEDLGDGLGVIDPVSGPVVQTLK